MHTILIVEDEPSIIDNMTFALETEGFSVVACYTGGDALNQLDHTSFDLIILDVGLPDCNGFELARQIRGVSSIPIIFLTARSSEIDRVVGLELGADDYVTKPFSPRELSARVKAVLRRTDGNNQKSNNVQHSSVNHLQNVLFSIDAEKMRIDYLNQSLDLSRTEYRLLKLLISRPGRVYRREELMEHAWEHGGVSLERTVDTHIKTIRQKLKAINPDDNSIVTHRGTGYSLRDGE